MRSLVLIALLILAPAVWATDSTHTWTVTPIDNGLYALEMDSVGQKSLIVEYDKSICLVEVALSDKGGTPTLTDNREAGEALLAMLREHFPNKPLTTVLHSHWHPHSLASVAPLLEAGVHIITTDSNFARIREIVDTSLYERSRNLIQYVESDSILLGEGSNRIVVYRLTRKDYPNLATPEYLFFYFPEKHLMHCGCMYSKWTGKPIRGHDVLYPRAEDLSKFITTKNLPLEGLIRLNYEKGDTQTLPYAGLEEVVANGISSRTVLNPYRDLPADSLRARRDVIVCEVLRDGIPGSWFNGLAFGALGKKDLATAKEYAIIQALTNPSDPNSWDTLGEIYYFLGDTTTARAYETHSRKIDPTFTTAGVEVWQKDLSAYQEKWKKL